MQALLIVGSLTEEQKSELGKHFPGIQTREVAAEALTVERSVKVETGIRCRFSIPLPNNKGFANGNVVLPATQVLIDHANATEPLESKVVGEKRGWFVRGTEQKGSSWYKLQLAQGEIAVFGISARADGKDGAVIDCAMHIGQLESGRAEAKLAEVVPIFGGGMLSAQAPVAPVTPVAVTPVAPVTAEDDLPF